MNRVSSEMSLRNMQYYINKRNVQANKLENQISSNNRLQRPSDDPLAAASSTRLSSHINHINQYMENIDNAKGQYSLAEASIQTAVNVMQRVRELAVQTANGTYGSEDLAQAAVEVNEYIDLLMETANIRPDGRAIFGGNDTEEDPFVAMKGRVSGINGPAVTEVRYRGNIVTNKTHIDEGRSADLNFVGNTVFWAQNQQLFAQRDVLDYVVAQDSTISIDGKEIQLRSGDNIYGIISRINDSDLAVKASLDPVSNSFTLETTVPHQIWLDEDPNDSVLKDLGILSEVGSRPPSNLHPDVAVGGGSLFDMVISFRDSLLEGDNEAIGGRILGGLDQGLESLVENQTRLGAMEKRLDHTASRLGSERINLQTINSNLTNTDFAKAIVEKQMVEFVQQAAYQSAAKILQPSLMDFLR